MTDTSSTTLNQGKQENKQQVELRLRLVAPSTTVEGKVLRYLNQNPNLTPKQLRERVIGMLCDFWFPYVCDEIKDGDSKQAARESVYQLQRHIDRIKRDFGLTSEMEPQQIAIGPAFIPQYVPVAQPPQPATTPVVIEQQHEKQEPAEPAPLDQSFYDSLDVFEN